ncbi:DNA repair protein RecO [Candidatus Peregrinibacteria bacterium]|nr:MAG: DNA repair protein RecO [Candidatus Peregrinibacteria bacterium]
MKNSKIIHALFLSKVYYKECDAIITLFSKELGKISAYVRNIKKPKSKIGPYLQQGTLCQFFVKKGKGNLYSIQESSAMFVPEIDNYEDLLLLNTFSQYIQKTCPSEHAEPEIFNLIQSFLPIFCQSDKKKLQLYAFSLKILTHLSFIQFFDTDAETELPIPQQHQYFFHPHGISSTKQHPRKISLNEYKILKFYQTSSFENIEKLNITLEQEQNIEMFIQELFLCVE